jgi:NTE family protein
MLLLRIPVFIFLFMLSSFAVAGQQNQPLVPCGALRAASQGDRPLVGLALEGGSAYGLAHIGVLQLLEQMHIPVDCIAGTSMGGLIGGFYATGMSGKQLQQLTQETDWNHIIAGGTPYQALSFRRKEDQRALPNSLLFGLQNGFSLPAGLNAGDAISLMIDNQTLPYNQVHFDDLPIPFRCVAMDIIEARETDFANGPLNKALRATMSIPGLFTPVPDGERLYVDGGVVNNLPSNLVREMGADIVIAVDLKIAKAKADDIVSLVQVLGQTARAVITRNEERGRAGADIVITVDLASFEPLDFDQYPAIIAKGVAAARAQKEQLNPYRIQDDKQWQAYLRARTLRERNVSGAPQFVEVSGTGLEATRVLEEKLAPLAGKPIDPTKLEEALTPITGTGTYDTATYQLTQRDTQDAANIEGLLVSVHETTYAPPMIQPAFEVDGGQSSVVDFTLGARLTFIDIAGFRSEWRTDFELGNTYAIQSEFYRPFSPSSNWFLAPRVKASESLFHIVAKNDPVADYLFYRDIGGLDLGYQFGRSAEIRVGYEAGYLNDTLRLGTPQFASVEGYEGSARLHFLLDHTDGPVLPRNGYSLETNFHWFNSSPGATGAFPALDARAGYFHPLTDVASLFFTGEGGTTFGYNNTGLPQYFLGGPFRLSAYGQNELHGNQYYLFRTGYRHDVFSLPALVGRKVYAVASWEFGKMYGAANSSAFPTCFTAGLYAETAVGPVFIGDSVGDSGHQKWFFIVGRAF